MPSNPGVTEVLFGNHTWDDPRPASDDGGIIIDWATGDASSHFPTETIRMTYVAIEWTYAPEPSRDDLSLKQESHPGSQQQLAHTEPDGVVQYSAGDTLIHDSHFNDYLGFEDYDAGQPLHSAPGMYLFAPFSDFI